MSVTNLQGDYDLILYGLGVMGENLVRNFARNGYRVIGVNYVVPVTEKFARQVAREDVRDRVGVAETLAEACKRLKSPGGAVLTMITANDPVTQPWGPIDQVFFSGSQAVRSDTEREEVPPLVELAPEGTVIIDGGNSHPRSTRRRCAELEKRNMLFLGAGVSGGPDGALKGPCIMPGGSRKAYDVVGKMLQDVAAQADGPCCAFMGPHEAGHYVKSVHNGIEYGIMQAISEVYHALARLLGLKPAEIQPIFAEMNAGRHGGYLMEISTEILGLTDAETGAPMLDVVLDRAGQKGTGKWTSQLAFDLGVPVPTLAGALHARIMSSFKPERVAAADALACAPLKEFDPEGRDKLIEAAGDALYGAMIASYAQGCWLIQEASRADPDEHGGDYDFTVPMDEVARIWKGGCVIRSRLLDPIREAFLENPDLHNIMLAPPLRRILNDGSFQQNWRAWVRTMVENGLPADAIGNSLNYFDTYRAARLPADMIQAQRDRFGKHGFERTDRPGKGHHLPPTD